jgi:hypothetical protein
MNLSSIMEGELTDVYMETVVLSRGIKLASKTLRQRLTRSDHHILMTITFSCMKLPHYTELPIY